MNFIAAHTGRRSKKQETKAAEAINEIDERIGIH